MKAEGGAGAAALWVDGGMSANDWLCQFLADMLQAPVERPSGVETTALGAAFLAGLAVGVWPSMKALGDTWRVERRFEPKMAAATRERTLAGWRDAVARTLMA
jgi:glycerol kinase